MKRFLQAETLAISIYFLALLLFGGVFWLLDLSLYGFVLAACLLSFVTAILLTVKYLDYQTQENFKESNDQLIKQLKNLKLNHLELYQSLEDYFILWIHQIKTPITAAKLLAEDQKQNEFKRLLLDIEHYTQLAMSFLKLNKPGTDLHIESVQVDHLISPLLRKYSQHFIHSKPS